MAFDLLYRDGRDLRARPLRDRRARLEDIVAGSELVEAWKQVVESRYEGLVAKALLTWHRITRLLTASPVCQHHVIADAPAGVAHPRDDAEAGPCNEDLRRVSYFGHR